jgi:single-strand DNA-binding protein
VCSFTIAVNRRKSNQNNNQPDADFFRITAWRQLAEICQKYLSKGKKVFVSGSVSVSTYEGKDGKTYASMEVTADDIEFLSAKGDTAPSTSSAPIDNMQTSEQSVFTQVDESELPF